MRGQDILTATLGIMCVVIHDCPMLKEKQQGPKKEELLKRSLCSTNITHITAAIEEITDPNCPRNDTV